MEKTEISIDIVSDVVCPWCYIGKRRLERAVRQLDGRFHFNICYLPFQLNPDTPAEGFDRKEYLTEKFGSEERYQELTNYVADVAKQEGLCFDFSKQKTSPNTRDAHRIIWSARQDGKQENVKEAFMRAYFQDGVDLTQKDNLISVAVGAGLSREKVESLLNSQEAKAEVEQSEILSRQRGVRGVPFYIINNQYGVSGAQPSETFVQVLTEIGKQAAAQGEVRNPEDSKR